MRECTAIKANADLLHNISMNILFNLQLCHVKLLRGLNIKKKMSRRKKNAFAFLGKNEALAKSARNMAKYSKEVFKRTR